jgi:hypothetical protein
MSPLTHDLIPNGNVADVLTRILPLHDRDWLAIVRNIDSTHATDGLSNALAFHRVAYNIINGNVCLSIEAIQKAVSKEVFTGFDEVWIIAGSPPASDLSMLPSATSDGADFSSRVPEGLLDAMVRTNCILIVGDGCGLNYATTSSRLQGELAGTKA